MAEPWWRAFVRSRRTAVRVVAEKSRPARERVTRLRSGWSAWRVSLAWGSAVRFASGVLAGDVQAMGNPAARWPAGPRRWGLGGRP